MTIIEDITSFINGIKDFFDNAFNFLPTELIPIFVSVVIIVIALYIYRLAK